VHARTAARRLRRSAAGAAGTAAAKRSLRSFGELTAELRPFPDFLIIGAKRGGTTSLDAYLREHPAVPPLFPRAQKIKGTYFFDENWARGERWYRSHFPTRAALALLRRRTGATPRVGEASPYYLFHPLAPQRAASLVPHARIVVLLRDPVERAFSHYKERLENDTEPLSFDDAVAAEDARIAGEEARIVAEPRYVSVPHRHQSYVAQGRYATPLRRWMSAFPREQILVLPSELLYRETQATYDAVCDHIWLGRHRLVDQKAHEARPSVALSDATRSRLRSMVADDVAALEALVGSTMGWPK